ncbi:MAG TPA: tRNA (adenosine(37)-N6)-threonylcarbamoyltransferase complex transferase subunit TsaD, partial [Thermomicrobiales bacterium]|nr:tRNA (adenosine(37)-N6)-threonylcarbamoyltransferase complex transferase subunit TsaD [Thermomicrobiales bacterium]
SCDETSAAVVSGGRRVLSSIVSSQFELHECHGGVVPELAARRHVTAIVPVVERALREAGVDREDLDAIAVTQGPGLAGALVVGMNAAKGMAYALDRPLVAVNHLEAHIYANWLCDATDLPEEPVFPILCLLVSGGHTELILMTGHGRFRHLGRTLDDAAGEAFDKGARLLGLGFPGGPAIEEAARKGDPHAFELPRSWLIGTHDFSFSGLKTALLRLTEPMRLPESDHESESRAGTSPTGPFRAHRAPMYAAGSPIADLAAGFQQAIVEPLAVKTARAAVESSARAVVLAGGVAANSLLRERLRHEVLALCGPDVSVAYPAFAYCTDNAAMVAGAAAWIIRRGDLVVWEADVYPRLPLMRP